MGKRPLSKREQEEQKKKEQEEEAAAVSKKFYFVRFARTSMSCIIFLSQ